MAAPDVRRWESPRSVPSVVHAMNFPSEQQLTFLPILVVDWSMEHSHRRTAIDDDTESSATTATTPGTPRHRLVGFLVAKALAPLRLIGAR